MGYCTKNVISAARQTAVETSYHASTIEIDESHGVDFFANAVRSEWAIETGYHGKRDFSPLRQSPACAEQCNYSKNPPSRADEFKVVCGSTVTCMDR